jgi:5'-3' exonuclease
MGIQPLFVFDGKTTMAKQDEIKKRRVTKKRAMDKAKQELEQMEQEIEELEARVPAKATSPPSSPGVTTAPESAPPTVNLTETPADGGVLAPEVMADIVRHAMLKGQVATQVKKATRQVEGRFYGELRELFQREKIPYAVARYEGEKACVWLMQHGHVDLVISDDYDCLPCGAPVFFQHFLSKKKHCTQRLVTLAPLITHLGFSSHEQFVDYCILVGTDFGGHLPGIGLGKGARGAPLNPLLFGV